MDLRRELLTTVGLLVILCVLLAFGSLALLDRMGPAIEQILRANVYSTAAAEDALVVVANAGDRPLDAAARAQLRGALDRLEGNVTEDAERPILAAVEASLDSASAAPGDARVAMIAGLVELAEVNRAAMRRADEDARRLGRAGAWVAALLGLVGLCAGLLVYRRARERLLLPIVEIDEVLASVRGGTAHRRCRARKASAELTRIATAVNRLLDERAENLRTAFRDLSPQLSSALLTFLEERPAPTFIVDRGGAILRANERGLDALTGPIGGTLRERLHAAAASGEEQPDLEVRPLGNFLGYICTCRGALAAAPSVAPPTAS